MSALAEQAHNLSTRVTIQEAARSLQDLLSRRLTAYMLGVKDAKTITRWASGEVTTIRYESEERLRCAYEIVQLLTQFDTRQIVRAWFIGLNPQLGDVSPAQAIRDGQLKEALGAARAFIAGG
ncbi:MAG TPA: hypothetical protein VFL91_02315 [Thermomicrobiales bacterium]|nr:hypothetical protein [Thermomicrobiales bacterium]